MVHLVPWQGSSAGKRYIPFFAVLSLVAALTIAGCKSGASDSPSSPFTPPPGQTSKPPFPPGNLKATTVSTSEIDLTWIDTNYNNSGYIVEMREGDSGSWQSLDSVNRYTRIYHARSLHCNAFYMFAVRSYNGFGASAFSNFVRVQTFLSSVVMLDTRSAEDLYGVAFTGPSTGFAVGNHGCILRTLNGGVSWDTLASGTTQTLRSISFSDPLHGMICGFNGVILSSTDGGNTWTAEHSGTTQDLRSIAGGDSLNWITVGQAGAVYHSHDGGITWTRFNPESSYSLNAVSFPSPSYAIVVGATGSIMMTHNAGRSWGIEHGRFPNTLNGVSFLDSLHGFIVGAPPLIVRTTNGGVVWTSTDSVNILFNDVAFASQSRGMACGKSGKIAETTDGGGTWTLQALDIPITLNAVCSVDSATFVAVGLGGLAVRYVICSN